MTSAMAKQKSIAVAEKVTTSRAWVPCQLAQAPAKLQQRVTPHRSNVEVKKARVTFQSTAGRVMTFAQKNVPFGELV